jgi:tetratricopeptide (TPR) repeat protein
LKNSLIIFFLIFNSTFSQNVKKCCNDNIQIETIKKQSYLNINNIKSPISIKLNKIKEYNINYDIDCFTSGFNLLITIGFGNEYTIVNYIFEKENGKYFLKYTYRETSNRNSSTLEGRVEKNQSFKDILMTDENIFGKFPLLIENSNDLQNEKTGGTNNSYFPFLINMNKAKAINLMIIANHYYVEKYDVFDTQKIDDINNLAYYLQLQSKNKEAIYLLDKVLTKDPSRSVAWLNLGDAQWGIGDIENTKKSYQKYISLMKTQGKDLNKIPKRVYERIK